MPAATSSPSLCILTVLLLPRILRALEKAIVREHDVDVFALSALMVSCWAAPDPALRSAGLHGQDENASLPNGGGASMRKCCEHCWRVTQISGNLPRGLEVTFH